MVGTMIQQHLKCVKFQYWTKSKKAKRLILSQLCAEVKHASAGL